MVFKKRNNKIYELLVLCIMFFCISCSNSSSIEEYAVSVVQKKINEINERLFETDTKINSASFGYNFVTSGYQENDTFYCKIVFEAINDDILLEIGIEYYSFTLSDSTLIEIHGDDYIWTRNKIINGIIPGECGYVFLT